MNELRWIILGIGVLIIAAIYFWESWKHKQNLRARVDKYPADTADTYSDVHISPKKEKHREKNIDLSAAASAFNSYLKKSRSDSTAEEESMPLSGKPADTTEIPGKTAEDNPAAAKGAPAEETIVVIYVVAIGARKFPGSDVRTALEAVDMQYGDMQIFHYHGHGDEFRDRALFSVANIHEPGTFDPDTMDTMTTDGLAMFMCLPAPIGGDIAFEIMLDCARSLADQLGGELRNAKHDELDNDGISHLRRVAEQY